MGARAGERHILTMSQLTPDRIADVQLRHEGTLIGFEPLTQAARDWFSEHLPDDMPTLGNVAYVETRYADQSIDGLVSDGLIVQWPSC